MPEANPMPTFSLPSFLRNPFARGGPEHSIHKGIAGPQTGRHGHDQHSCPQQSGPRPPQAHGRVLSRLIQNDINRFFQMSTKMVKGLIQKESAFAGFYRLHNYCSQQK